MIKPWREPDESECHVRMVPAVTSTPGCADGKLACVVYRVPPTST